MFFWNRGEASEFDNYRWDENDPPPTSWYAQRLFLFAFIVVGGISVGAALYGQTMAEKSLTALAQPVGLIWIGMSLVIYFCLLWRRYVAASCCFLCWLVLTLAGNQIVSNWLAESLESRYYHINPYEGEPHQYGLLLGGGANNGPNGLCQANVNGDRLVVASRMYHSGQLKKIICSGTNSYVSDQTKNPSETAFEVLQGLGVPEGDLISMAGANTSQEMSKLKLWIDKQIEAGKDPGRVALITSAWHLPRAQRLASQNQLEVTPMPANFLSESLSPSPHVVIPGSYQLFVTSQIVKEFMAGIVKR